MTAPPTPPMPTSDGPTSGLPEGARVLLPISATPPDAAQVNVSSVRRWGLELGLADVGAAAIDANTLRGETFARRAVQAWVDDGRHADLEYMEAPRQSPQDLLPQARTVLVGLATTEPVAPRLATDETANGKIAAYARGLDYHHVLKDKLWRLTQRLCNALGTPLAVRVCVDTAPLLERYWATCAGVAFVGKSTMAIAPGIGSRVVIGLALLDHPLPSSTRVLDGCGTCTRCLDACPTQAFSAPYVLDARKCISYLTIENPGDIDEELRTRMGSHVFGCDVCQTVCPYNASRKLPAALAELQSTAARQTVNLASWLTLTSGDYRRLTQHSALRRTPRAQLQRNAAVALGNAKTPDALAKLAHTLSHNKSPLVRKHAAWALGQLAHEPVDTLRQLLRAALETETESSVCDEIERVLAQLPATPSPSLG